MRSSRPGQNRNVTSTVRSVSEAPVPGYTVPLRVKQASSGEPLNKRHALVKGFIVALCLTSLTPG